jgi:hypothetical protein
MKKTWATMKKKVPCGTRNLNDKEAAYCRLYAHKFTHEELAKKFSVTLKCVKRCIQGITYTHLDKDFPPMQYGQ